MRGFPNGRRAGCFALTQSLRSSVGRDFNRVFYQINNNSLYLVSAGLQSRAC